jgi:uncharacterized protein YdeI (YjbR/CyaY-like superfamily)
VAAAAAAAAAGVRKAAGKMASVYIPVQGTEEEVRVALDQLPADASDILDILKAEQAPLHLWLIIAREYFKQGKIEQFRQILEEGSGPGLFLVSISLTVGLLVNHTIFYFLH